MWALVVFPIIIATMIVVPLSSDGGHGGRYDPGTYGSSPYSSGPGSPQTFTPPPQIAYNAPPPSQTNSGHPAPAPLLAAGIPAFGLLGGGTALHWLRKVRRKA
ncbi:MAG TPA: hypothetical protein VHB27_08540 [Rhodopila sp.]|uniref:hypothetical protein n=1 Tax=Rhodopila sp. TaxID=2480087 RepID=UPI002C6FE28C|nr:hypothetical protein [Rhodopila sp.]HVY15261.1 hypothetical protein [Rhodopila sp.]